MDTTKLDAPMRRPERRVSVSSRGGGCSGCDDSDNSNDADDDDPQLIVACEHRDCYHGRSSEGTATEAAVVRSTRNTEDLSSHCSSSSTSVLLGSDMSSVMLEDDDDDSTINESQSTFNDSGHAEVSESSSSPSRAGCYSGPPLLMQQQGDDDEPDAVVAPPLRELNNNNKIYSRSRASPPLSSRSILKPSRDPIPVRNKGWKALPKVVDRSQMPIPMQSVNFEDTSVSSSSPNNGKSCDNSSTSSNQRRQQQRQQRRRVRFCFVVIRTYDRCVGDNPAVSFRAPIQLDWTYREYDPPLALDAYEISSAHLRRRSPRQLILSAHQRANILCTRFGYSADEVRRAEKEANKIRNQRSVTRALLATWIVPTATETLASMRSSSRSRRPRKKSKKQQSRGAAAA